MFSLTLVQKKKSSIHLLSKKKGYWVLGPILNLNCDFTPIFFHFVFLPLLFQNEGSVYPYSVTAGNGVKKVDR